MYHLVLQRTVEKVAMVAMEAGEVMVLTVATLHPALLQEEAEMLLLQRKTQSCSCS
jgi:hypothetical protein